MKKISMIFIAALAITFVSCDAKKNSENKDAVDSVKTEATAPEATTSADGDVLAAYEKFVKEAIPLIEKMKKGDATAAQDYAKITEELSKFVQENQDKFSAFTPEQAKRYAELGQELANAAK